MAARVLESTSSDVLFLAKRQRIVEQELARGRGSEKEFLCSGSFFCTRQRMHKVIYTVTQQQNSTGSAHDLTASKYNI